MFPAARRDIGVASWYKCSARLRVHTSGELPISSPPLRLGEFVATLALAQPPARKAGSIEERFKSLKRLRPRFPLPEKIMSFMWPRHMETFRNSGLWTRIESRLVSLGGEAMTQRCSEVFEDLIREEKTEVLAAIRGGEGYQSLWERPR